MGRNDDIAYVVEAIMQPDSKMANLMNAYVAGHEMNKAAGMMKGLPLYYEHDPSRTFGKVLGGYVAESGKHKGAIVQIFEVYDRKMYEDIRDGKLPAVSMGVDITMTELASMGPVVDSMTFCELSVCNDPAVKGAVALKASEVNRRTGKIRAQRLLASLKPHNVLHETKQKMTDSAPVAQPTQTPAVAPVAPTQPPAAPVTAPVAAPVAAPAVAPGAQPVQTPAVAPANVPNVAATPALAQDVSAEELQAADRVLEIAQQMASRAAAVGMTVEQYHASLEAAAKAKAEMDEKRRKEEAELMSMMQKDDQEKREEALRQLLNEAGPDGVQEIERTLNREGVVEGWKGWEKRYIEGKSTPEDARLYAMVKLEASKNKSMGHAQFSQNLAKTQNQKLAEFMRSNKPAEPKKVDDMPVSAKMTTDGTAAPVTLTASNRKRTLPQTFRLCASNGVEVSSPDYDVEPGQKFELPQYPSTNPAVHKETVEAVKRTRLFASANCPDYNEDVDIPIEQTAAYLSTAHVVGHDAALRLAASQRPAKVKYGYVKDMAKAFESTRLTASSKPPASSITTRLNAAMSFLYREFPEQYAALTGSDRSAPTQQWWRNYDPTFFGGGPNHKDLVQRFTSNHSQIPGLPETYRLDASKYLSSQFWESQKPRDRQYQFPVKMDNRIVYPEGYVPRND